jgi:hypothetical protein
MRSKVAKRIQQETRDDVRTSVRHYTDILIQAKLLDHEIAQYYPQLSNQQKQAVLSVVKTLAAKQRDWWDEISEEQREAIDKSLAEMKSGKLTSLDIEHPTGP